jgi:transcriptional regulator with GAF, ATPase, and Fis domain
VSAVNIDFLREVANILQAGMDSQATFGAVFDLLEKTLPFDSATLYLYKPEKDRLEAIHQKGDEVVDLADEFTFDRGRGLSSWVSKQTRPIILQSLVKSRPGRENRYCSFVSMPLRVGDKLIGVLNLGHHEPNVYKRVDSTDYAVVSSYLSIVLEKILLRRQLQEQNRRLRAALMELEQTQTQLVEKERLAAIGEIVVTINHEINNPLTAIVGLTEILDFTLQTGNREKLREGLRAILTEVKRIQRVTKKLTEIDRTETTEYVGTRRMTKLPT